jgi:hypothetical protein
MPARDIRAVLFDVGGPINTEVEHERLIDADIVAALADEGVAVTPEAYAAAAAWAVEHFAPDAHTAIISASPAATTRLPSACIARCTSAWMAGTVRAEEASPM